MSEYLASVPYSVSIAIGLLGFVLWFKACNLIGRYLASRSVEDSVPEIDMDLFAAEMAMEAAVLEDRLANQRRLEMAARFQ